MRLLLLGIDAAIAPPFQLLDTPFLRTFFDKGTSAILREDLLSRGWANIYTGEHARETRAFYEGPALDGSYRWQWSYKLSDLADPPRPLLWDALNARGYRVGIMNVPTTSPAPCVDGFFVSGGGGGQAVAQHLGPSQATPNGVAQTLAAVHYVLDERFDSLKKDPTVSGLPEFMQRLRYMTERRVDAYLALQHQTTADFGFLVFRSVAVVHFLLMSEVQKLLDAGGDPANATQELIADFYSHFDRQLQKLSEGLAPDRTLVVADHGMVVNTLRFNVNRLLVECGLQKPSSGSGTARELALRFRHFIPRPVVEFLKRRRGIDSIYRNLMPFDSGGTSAFCLSAVGTSSGVYVNDDERFGGPIPVAAIGDQVARVCNAVNEHAHLKSLGISARPYRAIYADARCQAYLPDVWLDMPDEITPVSHGPLIAKNTRIDLPFNLHDAYEGGWTGVKAKDVLLLSSANADPTVQNGTGRPLTYVYDAILDAFPSRA
jgi:hypothetical protein